MKSKENNIKSEKKREIEHQKERSDGLGGSGGKGEVREFKDKFDKAEKLELKIINYFVKRRVSLKIIEFE
jgi:hypothetical protein